jgi:hypothetical protein
MRTNRFAEMMMSKSEMAVMSMFFHHCRKTCSLNILRHRVGSESEVLADLRFFLAQTNLDSLRMCQET